MNNSNNPLNKENLTKASMVGVGMAIGGIVLFLIVYGALANAGVDALARVIIALCIPPAIMAALVGGYFLIKQPQSPPPPTIHEPAGDSRTDEITE